MKKRRDFALETVWYLLVFGFFLVWFTQIHRLSVYDADDWRYVSHVRTALPLWNDWNPSRVFPEVFMPLVSRIAVFALMPLVGEYLRSLTLMHGFVVTVVLTVYIVCFTRMMKRLFDLSSYRAVVCSALFLVFHFLMFRSYDDSNTYLFYCWDITCYYYYLIPAAINASIVMSLIGNTRFPEFLKNGTLGKKSLLLVLLYFAIFSNLPASGILAVYAGAMVLLDILQRLGKKSGWKDFLKTNGFSLAVLGLWLVSALFELAGGRAGDLRESSGPLLQRLRSVAYQLFHLGNYCNPTFLCICGIILGLAVIVLVLSKGKDVQTRRFFPLLMTCLVACAAMTAYTVLLCAAVDSSYINRMEYQFPLLFFLLLTLLLLFGYVLQKLPKLLLVMPIVLCVLFTQCDTIGRTYLESNLSGVDPSVCDAVTQDMLDQIIQADREGLTEITMDMPQWNSPDNWPHAVYLGEKMSDTLYDHGLIDHKILVWPSPTPEYNIRFGLS